MSIISRFTTLLYGIKVVFFALLLTLPLVVASIIERVKRVYNK